MRQKELVKFTHFETKRPIYIDLQMIGCVDVWHNGDPGYNSPPGFNGGLGPNGNPIIQEATRIQGEFGIVFVAEHIAEVLALLEGRDPNPARIMFGKRSTR